MVEANTGDGQLLAGNDPTNNRFQCSEASTLTVTVGRPSVVWLCGLDGWSQPRAGWALDLKKTLGDSTLG